jgi:hypothetical protein
MHRCATILAIGLCALLAACDTRAEIQGSPDILVLGDSQLSFGAGEAFVDLLTRMGADCGLTAPATVGVIGVRSSSLRSWTGTTRRARSAICDVDPTWNVNAGVYGSVALTDNPWVQIGRGEQFQFCRADLSPLQAVFADNYYEPELLIMFLMGNAAERWAGSYDDTLADVRAFVSDLPPGQPCIFMTSAPTYRAASVELRQRAQDNLERAFAQAGGQCSFVPGFTPETIAENLGNAANFRRNDNGAVRDPFHPTETGARRFLSLRRDALCQAIDTQLGRLTAQNF